LQDAPLHVIAQTYEFSYKLIAIGSKSSRGEARYIFQHYRFWLSLFYQVQSLWKEVSLVSGTKLFARNSKRRASYTACEQVYSSKIGSIDSANIAFNHSPGWAIAAQRLTGHWFNFNGGYIAKTGTFYT